MAQAAGHDINYIGLVRRAACDRSAGPEAGTAPQSRWRFRRRRHVARVRHGVRTARSATFRQRPGHRRCDGRWCGRADGDVLHDARQLARFTDKRGTNLLDGGAHFYDTYETSDANHICIGSIEPQFYALLLEKAGLDRERFKPQMDAKQWPALKEELTRVFKTKTQAQWCEIMEGSDVCFAPVLSIFEAPDHPHNRRAQQLRQRRRCRTAGAGAALQPHQARNFAWRAASRRGLRCRFEGLRILRAGNQVAAGVRHRPCGVNRVEPRT